jgi:CDP-diglyceride synthetase
LTFEVKISLAAEAGLRVYHQLGMSFPGRRVMSTSAGWVFLPALGSPLAHAPVLRWDLMPALNRPISKRLFGANKTWRGVLMMNAGTVAGAEILYRIPAYRQRLPRAVAGCHGRVGMILGIAIWAGELPNSFVKRRLGIPPGQQKRSPLGAVISLFDQADWVPVASVLLRPVWRMSGRDVVEVAALVAVIHIPINVIGYLIGARTAPM